MNHSKKVIFRLTQLTILLVVLMMIELICYSISHDKNKYSFFINIFNQEQGEASIDNFDLLTGWTYTTDDIEQSKYKVENEMVVLDEFEKNCADTFKVLITGGSTADLTLEPDCWPLHLSSVLKKQYPCLKFRVAAVAGFHSGQELLKLISLLRIYKPDVHISYSGGNEYSNTDYVTDYEKELFFQKNNSNPVFMPYTVSFIRTKLGIKTKEYSGKNYGKPYQFWSYNLSVMNALSIQYNYSFYGILSPVLGVGIHKNDLDHVLQKEKYKEHHDGVEHSIEMYQEFYDKALIEANKNEFIYNFTNVFEHLGAVPFMDDSHIEPQYQPYLANEIAELLLNSNEK